MKKRNLGIVLTCTGLIFALAGCGSQATTSQSESAVEATTEAAAGEATEESQTTAAAEETEAAKEETEDKSEEKEVTVVGVDTSVYDVTAKPRLIVTTDGEVDDENSLRHLLLYANDIDLDGIVYSASQFHWQGDGNGTTLGEVTEDNLNAEEDGDTLTSYRPQNMGWIEALLQDEYAVDYVNLVQNDADYPTAEELLSKVRIGNVEFEGDVREATEGSDYIKDAILDDDNRPLYIESWGGFNTVARALLSIESEYKDTDEWDDIYKKVCGKVVIQGNGQDKTYETYIVKSFPDLIVYNSSSISYGYYSPMSAPADSNYMFHADWLTKNVKFDHGKMMSSYRLVGDGTHYEGEIEKFQYGETTTLDGKEFDQYDWLGEGDSVHWITLIPVGLRGLENGNYGTWAGRIMINGQPLCSSGSYNEYDYTTGSEAAFSGKRWITAIMEDWAVGVGNAAPEVTMAEKDFTAEAGETVELNAEVSDPNGDTCFTSWTVYEEASEYSGECENLRVWDAGKASTSFTVPKDAQAGDYFNLILQVKDDAEKPTARYAQVIVTVK